MHTYKTYIFLHNLHKCLKNNENIRDFTTVRNNSRNVTSFSVCEMEQGVPYSLTTTLLCLALRFLTSCKWYREEGRGRARFEGYEPLRLPPLATGLAWYLTCVETERTFGMPARGGIPPLIMILSDARLHCSVNSHHLYPT